MISRGPATALRVRALHELSGRSVAPRTVLRDSGTGFERLFGPNPALSPARKTRHPVSYDSRWRPGLS
eukprot:4409590-Lingulodinium_polyedra.AAC.1